MTIFFEILIILFAYLIGSFSSAIIVCNLLGISNPRETGSKNPGATNVLRIGGKKAAAITLLGDCLKGFIPVIVALSFSFSSGVVSLVAVAAFFGHLYPIFFGFQGGKGVATLLGSLIALSWPSALCWGGIWLIVAVLFRYASLAAITACIALPFLIWEFTHEITYVYATSFMSIVLIIRHRTNIRNLLTGAEVKLGKK